MMWIGLVAGIVVGALVGGAPGALVLGLLGWLVGVIVGATRKTPAKPEAAPADSARIRLLEARIARLEERVRTLEGGAALAPAAEEPGEAPAVAAPAVAAPAPVPENVRASDVADETLAAPVEPEPVPSPRPPAAPETPNRLVEWLTGGNTIARVGVVILFLGLAFLLKWAVDHAVLPPELRVGGVAVVGIALLVVGWRLRERRRGYALGLQGGGVAVLYLTTFAALRLYALLPPALAFALLAAIAVFSALLAVMQDALVLAAFGAGGGFLAPILASTGQGSHVVLFSYYLLLNLGIAGIAFFKSWRSLNILGFLFTFVIGTAWGWRFYAPEYFATTEPFLVAFLVLYVAIAIVQARRMAPGRVPYLDGILVFGVPIAAFALQAGLMRETEYGLAFSCIAASALYLALATALRGRESLRLLFECFLALGVVFATLAIPLALDARWTSALWALEGAAVVWIGLRQGRRVATGFGLAMQLLAGGAFVVASGTLSPGVAWLDAAFVGALIVAFAGLWTSRLLARTNARPIAFAAAIAPFAFAWGFAWLLVAAQHEIETNVARAMHVQSWVAFYAAASFALLALSRRLAWREAAWPSIALVPVLAILAWETIHRDTHPFALSGALAWAIAFFAHFHGARQHEAVAPRAYQPVEHTGGVLVLIVVLTAELRYWAIQETARHTAWSDAATVVPAAVALLLVCARAMDARWPVAAQPASYRLYTPAIVGGCAAAWILYANANHDGASDPLPYVPFFNALDLAHILIALTAFAVVLAARRSALEPTRDVRRLVPPIAAGLAFFWLNGVLLRTLHHWAGIPYRSDAMMRSMLVQASLSIFWSLLALALMVFAARRGRRSVWLAGAALMGVVVVKLFVVELSHVGAVERIVSFIVVGLLMLAIGYAAPVPPRVRSSP